MSDLRGRELPAMKVFACVIEYLKDRVLKNLEELCLGSLKREDRSWVITLPAFWDDKAKNFMQSAAQQVSIIKQYKHKYDEIDILHLCVVSYTRQAYRRISLPLHWNQKLPLYTADMLKPQKAQTQLVTFNLERSTYI